MRGKPEQQMAMLTSLSTEDLIPKDHPIRRIRRIVDAWRIGWYTSDWWIDFYCPTHPSPYCFNGSHYGSTQWSNNKL